MEFIIKPRAFGKTFELIQIANSSQRPILVASESHKIYIKQLCYKYGYDIAVYTVKDLEDGKTRSTDYKDFLIDEVDQVLKTFMKKYYANPIIGTLTIGGK